MKKTFAACCALIMAGMLLTGCDDLKQFAGDSVESIGGKITETVDTVSDALGLAEPTEEPTLAPKPNKVYEVVPKVTRTPEEEEAYQKEVEAIRQQAAEALAGRGKATPVPTSKADGDEKEGKKDKNKKDKATPTPTPDEAEPTAEPIEEPTEEPTQKPTSTPVPTQAPDITPGGGVADW